MRDLSSGKQYAAFISYGNEGNTDIAAAIETGLKRLAKPWNRMRSLEVFRDQTSLPAGSAVEAALFGVLDRSAWLIYLASPSSAVSGWVEQELRHWLRTRDAGRSWSW